MSDLTLNAKNYVDKKVKEPPETMPITFAGKDEEGIWYGDMWVNTEIIMMKNLLLDCYC